MKCGVYSITNSTTGDTYIGSTKDFPRRTAKHKHKLRKGIHQNRPLQAAWTAFGEAAFVFKMLLVCASSQLFMYEQLCLDGLQPRYNVAPTAGSQRGYKHGVPSLTRMSAAHRGSTHSEATRLKMSRTRRGVPKSAEHKAKISAARSRYWAARRRLAEQ